MTCPICESYHPENYKGDCRDNHYRRDTPFKWFSTGSGRIEFQLAVEDASSGSHSGRCDDDIEALRRVPYIAEQLAAIDVCLLASELREYGAWDAEELKDHEQNLDRILWIACGDITEGEVS